MNLKTTTVLAIFLYFGGFAQATPLSAELFSYDEEKIKAEFAELDYLEKLIIENPEISLNEIVEQNSAYKYFLHTKNYSPLGIDEVAAPGNIPSFWWSFTFSIIGSYSLYGAVAGPISVGVVYFSTDKDNAETKKAIYGCITGTVLGFGIKYLTSSLL